MEPGLRTNPGGSPGRAQKLRTGGAAGAGAGLGAGGKVEAAVDEVRRRELGPEFATVEEEERVGAETFETLGFGSSRGREGREGGVASLRGVELEFEPDAEFDLDPGLLEKPGGSPGRS